MYYIGVDLGGTNIAAGIVTEAGELIRKKSIPTLRERGTDAIIKDMAHLCLEILKEQNIDVSEIHSIGIGSPGSIDPANGKILYANNIKFKDVDIRNEMQKFFSLPIFVENDANCAALGESVSGAAKDFDCSVTVTLGTGVGGGIVLDGKIYSGPFYGAGEIGHHVIKLNGEQCTCGRKGCWEAYASATALIRETKIAALKNPASKINELVNDDFKLVNAKTTFDAADLGDETAIAVIDSYITYVAEGIANIINIFQPEIVVIGGGVCSQGDRILNPIQDYAYRLVYGGVPKTKIAIAMLGNDAGIIGAAMLGR